MATSPRVRHSRRAVAIVAAVTAALLIPAVAYAWISAHAAAGSGQVSTGGPLQNIDVAGPSSIALNLDSPVVLSGTFANPNTFTVSIARVKVTVTGINQPSPLTPFCDITPGVNFSTTDAVPTHGRFTVDGADALSGTGSGDWSGATIVFRSSPSFDQTACLGRRLNLKYIAVAG